MAEAALHGEKVHHRGTAEALGRNAADDLEIAVPGVVVDGALDGAAAADDAGAFERGAGGGGGADHARAGVEDDFAVGADVHEHVAGAEPGLGDAGHDVAADVARDARQGEDRAAVAESQRRRGTGRKAPTRGREGHDADGGGVDAVQKARHDGVAGHGDADGVFGADLGEEGVDRLGDGGLEFGELGGGAAGVVDAGDDVVAEPALGVERAGGGDDGAAADLDGGDGGRAHVHGDDGLRRGGEGRRGPFRGDAAVARREGGLGNVDLARTGEEARLAGVGGERGVGGAAGDVPSPGKEGNAAAAARAGAAAARIERGAARRQDGGKRPPPLRDEQAHGVSTCRARGRVRGSTGRSRIPSTRGSSGRCGG